MAATSIVLPKSATIVDSKEAFGSLPIGNVKVTFTDGHTEMWTKLGKALLPKLAKSGLIGWARYESKNDRGWPVPDTLRICWPADGHHKDFKIIEFPFIEEWDFADSDSAVIIKSRCAHGPAHFYKYDLATEKLLGEAKGTYDSVLPDWAKPFADN